MKNNTTLKEVAEVSIGCYQVTLDEEKLSILESFGDPNSTEMKQIQEMTDWLLDLCCDHVPDDQDCLKYLKYLKNIRGAFVYLQSISVTKKGGVA